MKALLVIDEMPKSCGQCPCVSFKVDKFECQWRYIDNPDIVQEWCPLKPMPRKNYKRYYYGNPDSNKFVDGWNACIDELLGEEE